MKHLIFILLPILFIFSCNTEEAGNVKSESEDSVIIKENDKNEIPDEKVELLLETIDSEEIVQTKVSSEYRGEKIDLYICEGGLSKVSSEDIFVDIPENAEQIISGFYAGLSTTIYITEEDTKFVVHIIIQDESGGSEEKVLTVFEK